MRTLIAALLVLTSGSAMATQCTALPVLFIVQDKSGSMSTYAPDGTKTSPTNPSKWSIAKTVVPNLVNTFSNRFRFGIEYFPQTASSWSCSVGYVAASVSNDPAPVANSYNTVSVGAGATPTAASLAVAQTYLLAQGFTTPKYVLLITDGMPNCSASAQDATTCVSSNNCSPAADHCGLASLGKDPAIDCLDDNDSVTAAHNLLLQGIKVFVVGFGSETTGVNKLVLDRIAAAGGTTSAYSAMDQASLQSVLNGIALDTTTCCNDVCTQGATQCTGDGSLQTCTYDATTKCNGWVQTSCPNKSICTSGKCQSCTDACTAGATQCDSQGRVQQCVPGAGGCNVWSTAQTCNAGEFCTGSSCGSCQACTVGATRCGTNGKETCQATANSCSAWVGTPCAKGSTCSNGSCASCNGTCTVGAKRCNGKGVETCVADTQGCTSWSGTQTCADFCSGGACGTCGTSCTGGDKRCNGTTVETCGKDSNNCPVWQPGQTCQANSYCASGFCNECPTSCTQGATQCANTGTSQVCQLDSNGCTAWVPTTCKASAGEKCVNGGCCADACTMGALQCSAAGRPQVCAMGNSGCTVWADQAACATTDRCIDGICRVPCADDEFHTCPTGTTCTGTTNGGYCLPDTSDAGPYVPTTYDAGHPRVDAGTATKDAGTGVTGPTNVGAAAGCGCTSFDPAVVTPLLGLALVGLRRRRRAA